nr:isoform 3 of twinfilin-1 [Quercus suber]
MQSGISASQDLLAAFKTFVSDPTQRFLLADISNEALVAGDVLYSTSSSSSADFSADFSQLQPHLSDTKALYILLKTHPDAADGYAAITFVPNAAPVRQKMLFASTRLTLVRELGIERFRQTLFVTEKEELTADGWRRHEAHTSLSAPLTAEETLLGGVKDAEAAESQGTSGRRGHVSAKIDVKVASGVVEALALLKQEGCKGTLVQLKYAMPGEVLTLDASEDDVRLKDVGARIHADEPRFSFYSHPGTTGWQPEIWFIYTCPTASKIKERMIYSTGKSWTRTVAERDAGIVIVKSVEATEPNELTLDVLEASYASSTQEGAGGVDAKPASSGFARPKRPGRR